MRYVHASGAGARVAACGFVAEAIFRKMMTALRAPNSVGMRLKSGVGRKQGFGRLCFLAVCTASASLWVRFLPNAFALSPNSAEMLPNVVVERPQIRFVLSLAVGIPPTKSLKNKPWMAPRQAVLSSQVPMQLPKHPMDLCIHRMFGRAYPIFVKCRAGHASAARMPAPSRAGGRFYARLHGLAVRLLPRLAPSDGVLSLT